MRGGALFHARAARSRRYQLPKDPRARTEWTLRKMAELSRDACACPDFRRGVVEIALGASSARDEVRQVAALLEWTRRSIRYIKDPAPFEAVAHPLDALEQGFGDCDDIATTFAAAAMAIGVPARFVAATNRADDPEWRHVWTEVYLRGRWVPGDPSHPTAPLGWAVRPQIRRLVLGACDADAQLEGFFDSIKDAVGDVLEGARDLVVNVATLKYVRKGLSWSWRHMGSDMRQLVSTIGPLVAEAFLPVAGGTVANLALSLLEVDRVGKEERKKAKRALEKAQAEGQIPKAVDLNNQDHLEALWLAGNMPAAEKEKWAREHGLAVPGSKASGSRAGLLVAAALVAAVAVL